MLIPFELRSSNRFLSKNEIEAAYVHMCNKGWRFIPADVPILSIEEWRDRELAKVE